MSLDIQKNGGWKDLEKSIAEKAGLAISVVSSEGFKPLSESNNNSVCTVVRNSGKFDSECGEYCGKVHEQSAKNRISLQV